MELVLAVVCDTAMERPDGKLDLRGVFHELSAPGFPALQDRMTAVFVVEWAPDEAGRQPLRADLVDGDGTRVLTIQGHTEVAPPRAGMPPPQTRLIMPMERVVFPHAGRFTFELIAGGDTVRACSVHLVEREADQEPGR
ncbi:MAG: hypothetical protein WEA24_05600 [Gemmatimonadota bacterium]